MSKAIELLFDEFMKQRCILLYEKINILRKINYANKELGSDSVEFKTLKILWKDIDIRMSENLETIELLEDCMNL